MGINDLQLSTEIIAGLYPETLVTVNHPAITGDPSGPGQSEPPKTAPYSFFGKNLRSVCVLVSAPNDESMPGEKLSFLLKILEACKYTLDDIALINIYRQAPDMEKLKNQFHPGIILLWGDLPEIPGIQYPLPDMLPAFWKNITVLPVTQVDLMNGNNPGAQELKRKLWTSLKKIFNL
jgi:hypothetical protein